LHRDTLGNGEMVHKPTKDRGRSFLAEVELRPLSIEDNRGLEPLGLALGEGRGSLNILGLKKDTVYKWVRNRQMPAHWVGRLLKF